MLFCERGNKNVVTEKVCIGKRDSKIRVIVLTTYFTHKVRHVPFRPNDEKSSLLFTFSLYEGFKTPLWGLWWNFAKRHSKIRVLVLTTYMSVDVMLKLKTILFTRQYSRLAKHHNRQF